MTTVSRRSVAKGAAWGIPALTVGAPAAFAAASGAATVSGTICGIHNGTGTVNNEGTYNVNFQTHSSTGTVPQGTVVTYTFTLAKGTAFAADTPVPTVSSSNASYSLTINPATGTASTPGTFTVTQTYLKDTPSDQTCSLSPYVVWQNTLRGGTQISVTSTTTGPAATVSGADAGVSWRAAHRWSGSGSLPYTPTVFLSKSGEQTCYPYVDYDYFNHSNPANWSTCGTGNSANDTSTQYPDGTCVMVAAPFTGGAKQVVHC